MSFSNTLVSSSTLTIFTIPKAKLPTFNAFKPNFKFNKHIPTPIEVKTKNLKEFSCACSLFSQFEDEAEYVVVNFYKFVSVNDPIEEVSKHLSFMKGRNIHGRIYINEQGINAQYSGPSEDALAYVEWLREDGRFSDLLVQVSPTRIGHAFPKLKLRYKPSLVQVDGGTSELPLLEPSLRATPLTPSEWRRRLEAEIKSNETTNANSSTGVILLDVRNGYEWDIGHFQGSRRPEVDCFKSTSFGLSQAEAEAFDPLANVDKEKTDILMYCTGGIRCDVYSTILRQKGFQNLYTLQGGISHYLEKEGPVKWVGNLFVFDSRLSLPPSSYNPEATTETTRYSEGSESEDRNFARCYICGSKVSELKHRNCASIDCNFLYLCCAACTNEYQGCCCLECKTAPRLRPVLPQNGRYKKWYIYRDMELQRR